MWRDLAIALSLANIWFLRIWTELLTYRPADTYLMKAPPSPARYAAAIFNVVLLGGLGWLLATLVRRSGSAVAVKLGRWAFLAFLLILPFTALRKVVLDPLLSLAGVSLSSLVVRGTGRMILGVACVAVGITVFRFSRQLARVAASVLLVVSPFLLATFAQAIRAATRYNPAPFADKSLASRLPVKKDAPRVLWIICDEWDQRLTYTDRNPAIELPEIDRFRHQALYALDAYPPGLGTTTVMPSFIVGKLVVKTQPLSTDELLLTFTDSQQPVRWSALPNIFSRARQAGFNTAVVGWHLPYCRELNASLTACWWWEAGMQHNSMGETFLEAVPNQTRSLFESPLMSPFGQSLLTHQHIRTYRAMLEHAEQVAGDPAFGLSLVHLPIPHGPHFYDASTGRFSRSNSPFKGYYDNLQLLDRTLGELLRSMERAGTLGNTAVLLSADHSYRSSKYLDGKLDPRVPFLLKLPGQKEGITYLPRLNTLVTHDLLLAVLAGKLSTPQAVATWLDQHR